MRILGLDIETAPNKVYAWGLWGQDIHYENILEPGYTLCWAAKWFGEKKVHFASVHHDGKEEMVRRIYELVDSADVICHYNGTKFDMPILNREFLDLHLPPPSTYSEIDLLKVVRRQFRLPSNKLDYVARHLGIDGKTKHMGMQMWRDCMDGCPKAWATMRRYNMQDTKLLETVYNRLLPWITPHPNMGHYVDGGKMVCPRCGSDKLKKDGTEKRTVIPYQRYRCLDCGGRMKGESLAGVLGKPLAKPT